MRFRLPVWDVDMPPPLVAYWTAWNEPIPDRVREHLDIAVTADVQWNDPRDSFVGVDELEAAVRRLRVTKPDYRFVLTSEIDLHHGRLRYKWEMQRQGRVLMSGLDVATLDSAGTRLCRVDGFFGEPTPVKAAASGVPAELRADPGRRP